VDALTFIASIVHALVWPVFLIVVVMLLRKPLTTLIPLLTKLKYKEFEIEFGKQIAEIKEEAATELPAPAREGLTEPRLLSGKAVELLRVSPRAAIIEAWREVELAAANALVRNKAFAAVQPYNATPLRLAKWLQAYHLLEPPKAGIFHDLRALRNQAAHAPDFAISEEVARQYIDLATRLVDYLDGLKPDP